jgi:AcrR family transcriptional regulator
MLDAAREVFEEKGYARATTREITSRAGVAESLLFRTFGSKANLFSLVVLAPLAEFFRVYVEEFGRALPSVDVTKTVYRFNESLYDMASQHRGLVLTFFATALFEPEVLADPKAISAISTIAHSLDQLGVLCESELRRLGVDLDGYDVRVAARMGVGTVLAAALLDVILQPTGAKAGNREHVLQELTRQLLRGGLNASPSDLGIDLSILSGPNDTHSQWPSSPNSRRSPASSNENEPTA